ncbi:VOC family protein [Bordetella sp. H567]|uniref:VOC family protein n=1 Tax=Bordetella sp. H567 TaxID=1697043 RepID=UPI001F158214|nr:VOC family protein [Bordetella sp. H567]
MMPSHDTPPGVTRADHTGFTVSSLDESLAFWVDVLGFRLVTRDRYPASEFLDNVVGVPGAELELAMVEAPGGHLIELLEYSAPANREYFKPRACDVGSVHLAFLVDDLDALLARVAGAGWMALGEPQTVRGGSRDGLRLFYARGPDGVTVEFLQPPRQADGRAAGWKNSMNER